MKIVKPASSRPVSLPVRRPRSDGQANKALILKVAKSAFTQGGARTSLDDITKTAGVGAGTLYRHFPTREALLEAVYSSEVDGLAASAEQFCRDLSPIDALRTWLLLFIDHLATKKIIAEALHNLVASNEMFEAHKSKVQTAGKLIYDRAVKSGDIRADINPLDHLRAILGVIYFTSTDDWKDSAERLVDILIQGSSPTILSSKGSSTAELRE
jgi:AcrR family transcriptional regulator